MPQETLADTIVDTDFAQPCSEGATEVVHRPRGHRRRGLRLGNWLASLHARLDRLQRAIRYPFLLLDLIE